MRMRLIDYITKPHVMAQTVVMFGMGLMAIGAICAPQQHEPPKVTQWRIATAEENQAWEVRQLSAELDRIAAQREAAAAANARR